MSHWPGGEGAAAAPPAAAIGHLDAELQTSPVATKAAGAQTARLQLQVSGKGRALLQGVCKRVSFACCHFSGRQRVMVVGVGERGCLGGFPRRAAYKTDLLARQTEAYLGARAGGGGN